MIISELYCKNFHYGNNKILSCYRDLSFASSLPINNILSRTLNCFLLFFIITCFFLPQGKPIFKYLIYAQINLTKLQALN